MATEEVTPPVSLVKEPSIEVDYIASSLMKPTAISTAFGKGAALSSNWMGALARELTLNEIVMLGSHDSGAIKGQQQYQDLLIGDQLKYGVRLLDLQLASHENEVWTYYGEACQALGDILMEIESFTANNPTEKVIVVLRNSKTAPNPVKWSDVKKLLEFGFSQKLIPKEDSGAKIGQMKGSVALVAPDELGIKENWGCDAIIHHSAPETTNTTIGLHDYLQELTYDALDKKEDKIVWVECRSRDKAPLRRKTELKEAQHPSFLESSEKLHFNVLSFSFISKSQYSLVKEYFVKWRK